MSEIQSVVVTGASRGIGAAIVAALANGGWRVHAVARTASALEELARRFPDRVRVHVADVTSDADLERLTAEVMADGAPYALINNAGVATSASLAKTSRADVERVLAINTVAPFMLTRAFGPAMAKAGGGRIVNIASIAGFRGVKYSSAYAASKHALLGITRSLALELGERGITVNAICPGWVDTEMLADAVARIARTTGRDETDARTMLAQTNASGRLISPEAVASLCSFLLSPQARELNGAAIPIE
jgi:NAD(P)-dependent dehydrogenase (short-subunit alcohol dehydrogenase family)